ncbi:spoIIIJ-associated protein [Frondihabitans sp. PhB188]|uniref:Jag family protein n=1 Tax=Frondihabitans sp. PhB188 TaxID=2485200 RepID=UPI000F4680ED|nr:R3H domain-containing nucleic acid-binding protein [Frondihabitans sp. PhB188]ROQ37085.1 spoIIIJ-associated protein [Frondihabitans sp. PhB188]
MSSLSPSSEPAAASDPAVDDAALEVETATADTEVPSGDDAPEAVDGASGAVSETGSPAGDSDLDEGDIAADYIEELLDILDLDGDIDIETRGGRSYISVDSSGENDLRVLSKPDTVTALQELTRIAVQTRTGEFSRLILDVGGSRATREQELTTLVDRAVARLEEGATSASLPPMSSYERKLVHDIVAARGFGSESEGEGRDRHTVVTRS